MDKRRIAQTIIKLQQAGKRMPQEMAAGADRQKEAQRILSETVELWYSIFEPQKVSAERWNRAEVLALTMSGAQGLNVNVISPALMQAALKQAETEYVQGNIARNEEEKRLKENDILPDGVNKMLWAWTKAKLAERRSILQYMPVDAEIFAYGKQIGISDLSIRRQKKLLACFLNDCRYAAEKQIAVKSRLLLDEATENLTLEVIA